MTVATARRRAWVACAFAAGALALSAAPAGATITATQVTQPAASYAPLDDATLADGSFSGALQLDAQLTGDPGDQVEIRCYTGSGPTDYQALQSTSGHKAFVQSDFPVTVSLESLPSRSCTLRVVPLGFTGSDLSAFPGPLVSASSFDVYSSNGKYDDLELDSVLPGAVNDVSSVSGGGLISGMPSSATVRGWSNAGVLFPWDGLARSETVVDGVNAYGAQTLGDIAGDAFAANPLAGLSAHVTSHDDATGDTTVAESEQLLDCVGPTGAGDPPTQAPTACTPPSDPASALADTGVRLDRTILVTAAGRMVRFTDTFTSTDGAAHTVALEYDNGVGQGGGDPAYRFPGETAFATHAATDSVPGPASAPGSVLIHTDGTLPDGDPGNPSLALTFSTAPNGFAFLDPAVFLTRYTRTVPAGGSITISQSYADDATDAGAAALARQAEDAYSGPAVTIASPASGATVTTPSVAVSGTATDNVGVTSLTVDGQAVPVASDGSWSTTVPLAPGANTITAQAADAQGNVTQAQTQVTFAPPTPAPHVVRSRAVRCLVPSLWRLSVGRARAKLRRFHCTPGRAHTRRTRHVVSGLVLSQDVRVGRQLPAGSEVGFTVSLRRPAHRRHRPHHR